MAKGQPYWEHLRCSTRVSFGLICKLRKRLERLARDKHSSLLGTFVDGKVKSFIPFATGHCGKARQNQHQSETNWYQCYKTFLDIIKIHKLSHERDFHSRVDLNKAIR
jgi:hypothetical protein